MVSSITTGEEEFLTADFADYTDFFNVIMIKVDRQTYDIVGAAPEVKWTQFSIGFQPVFARISRPLWQSEVIADEQASGVKPRPTDSTILICVICG
jgi:hypothetical protein